MPLTVVDTHRLPDSEVRDVDRLRQLLLDLPADEWQRLRSLAGDRAYFATAVAEVITDAVKQRSEADNSLGNALAPTIENSLQASVRRDPEPIANAIYPVIGPSIRKAINAALTGMMQSLNQMLERSLSLRSLAWRFQAWRTGTSFSQLVLLKTLIYRVEQVFFIHSETGILLHHLGHDEQSGNAEMVSGMLSAIQNFVQDSFGADGDQPLKSMSLGELTVRAESGPHAVVAVVARGNPPAMLDAKVRETVEKLHRQFADELASFQGDSTPFLAAHPVLEECVLGQQARRAPKSKPWFLIALAFAGLLLAAFYFSVEHQRRTAASTILTAFAAEPGLVVIEARRDGRELSVRGLRDIDARDPGGLVEATDMQSVQLRTDWTPFVSLEKPVLAKRILRLLAPPPGATVVLEGDTVVLSGSAQAAWRDAAVQTASKLPGVAGVDVQSLSVVPDREGIVADNIRSIEAVVVYFDSNESELSADQRAQLAPLIGALRELDELAPWRLLITGESDGIGSRVRNQALARQRAHAVGEFIIGRGFEPGLLNIDTRVPVNGQADPGLRRVSFSVHQNGKVKQP